MDYTIEQIIPTTNKPCLYVDYNELLAFDTVMLSQSDTKADYHGTPITLYEGMELIGYQEDEDITGARDDIIMEGICIHNRTEHSPHVKWLLQSNNKGIRWASDIIENGW